MSRLPTLQVRRDQHIPDNQLGPFRLVRLGALGWLIGLVLLVNVLRQKRWTGLIQSAALIALCFWQAWQSTHGVIRIWTNLIHWLGLR